MTIKEYCESMDICENCLLFNICRQKQIPREYSYSSEIWVTHQLLKLLEILSEK